MHGKFVILTLALLAALILGGCTVFFLDEGDNLLAPVAEFLEELAK